MLENLILKQMFFLLTNIDNLIFLSAMRRNYLTVCASFCFFVFSLSKAEELKNFSQNSANANVAANGSAGSGGGAQKASPRVSNGNGGRELAKGDSAITKGGGGDSSKEFLERVSKMKPEERSAALNEFFKQRKNEFFKNRNQNSESQFVDTPKLSNAEMHRRTLENFDKRIAALRQKIDGVEVIDSTPDYTKYAQSNSDSSESFQKQGQIDLLVLERLQFQRDAFASGRISEIHKWSESAQAKQLEALEKEKSDFEREESIKRLQKLLAAAKLNPSPQNDETARVIENFFLARQASLERLKAMQNEFRQRLKNQTVNKQER